MIFTEWLERQILLLEREIVESEVFDPALPVAPQDIRDLKATIVLYRFLQTELQRREQGEATPLPRAQTVEV